MINSKNKASCTGCYACYSACPVRCIDMVEDDEGFEYPIIDDSRCINCKICEKTCPILNGNKANKVLLAFACYAKSDEIRLNSSSGGISSVLAQNIIRQTGVVFGAGYDEKFNVLHKCITSFNDVPCIRGSKYVQSKIRKTYIAIQKYLENGKTVLFSGTPCQIAGLKNYLEKDHEKLMCVDFICHGVPSPKVWGKYIQLLEKRYNSLVKNVYFRCKEKGWGNYSLKIEFLNGQSYCKPCKEDSMLKGFSQNLFLRPSCYNCQFKSVFKDSDITLADFWGIKNVLPDMYSEKGVSLVLLNSEKGKQLFFAIQDEIVKCETDIDIAIKYNPSMTMSSIKSIKREKFFKRLDKEPIDQLIDNNIVSINIVRVLSMIRKIKSYFLGGIKR